MSDDTFTRRFNGDRADLAKIGIEIRVLDRLRCGRRRRGATVSAEGGGFPPSEVDFTPAELTALSMALAALDGRFAYARPLRLALTAICHGRQGRTRRSSSTCCRSRWRPTRMRRKAGKQLARLEDAVARGRTVRFSYPGADPDAPRVERTVDPYSLFFIEGHWYVVGRDHLRDGRPHLPRDPDRRARAVSSPRRTGTSTCPPTTTPRPTARDLPGCSGPLRGSATISVGDDLAWYVERLAPHVQPLPGGRRRLRPVPRSLRRPRCAARRGSSALVACGELARSGRAARTACSRTCERARARPRGSTRESPGPLPARAGTVPRQPPPHRRAQPRRPRETSRSR